jgi:hypothetical protein
MRLVLLAAMLASGAAAQDAPLTALHATLVELRSQTPDPETMGASEKLTVAKHQLRDWIEGQLGGLKDEEDTKAFEVRINQALEAVGAGESNDDQNTLGSIGEVQFSSEGGLLIVITGVGIICQDDESAYAYKRVEDRWKRVWEWEQSDYGKGRYNPQIIDAVHVWQNFEAGHEEGPPFVMVLSNFWGCISTWHDVTYRVWRVDPTRSTLLVDGTEWAHLGLHPIVGSIGESYGQKGVDVLIEFTGRSVDVGVLERKAVRHFLIDGDRVTRVDPVAVGPRDFVDEWLTRPWEESARWSVSPNLRRWYGKVHADFVTGEFGDTMHCATPDLWQVTFRPSDAQRNSVPHPAMYYLIRWRPPYHFTMVSVSATPWPRCTEKDADADAWRTLFASQEWR